MVIFKKLLGNFAAMNDDNIRSRMLPPLPERLRPRNLDEYAGQKHLIGQGCVIRNMIESGNLTSFILWGPPGVGKTTLSRFVDNTATPSNF